MATRNITIIQYIEKSRPRRFIGEVVGTFLLVSIAMAASLSDAITGFGGEPARLLGPGLTVMAVILATGNISGAHLNPVVTLAFFLRGEFPAKRIGDYIFGQLIGGLAGGLFVRFALASGKVIGLTQIGHVAIWQAILVEVVATFFLVSVILGTASGSQNVGPLSALAVGGTIIVDTVVFAPFSGASMNPVRSLAAEIVDNNYLHFYIYLIGPLMGSLIAVGVAYALRGGGHDPVASQAAQGKLE
ncbi:MAG: aquaporin [Actinomycetota bacterium]|nr:aquaporin [Actinomycetota bacterium]